MLARGQRTFFELPLGAQPQVVETGRGAALRQQRAARAALDQLLWRSRRQRGSRRWIPSSCSSGGSKHVDGSGPPVLREHLAGAATQAHIGVVLHAFQCRDDLLFA